MDMRSSSRQEQKIKFSNLKIEGANKVQFGDQYKVKAVNDDIEITNRVSNRLKLEDDKIDKITDKINKLNDELNEVTEKLEEIKPKSHINLTPNSNIINLDKNTGNLGISCSNVLINGRNKEDKNYSNNFREISQLSKINMKLKEINSKLSNNDTDRYNLMNYRQEDRNINSKSTKLLKSIIMVKKEYMKSPQELNRNVVIIDNRKDNYDKLDKVLRSDKFVDKIVEKIEKNRLERERIEKTKLLYEEEKKEKQKLERERNILEREKERLQKEKDKREKDELEIENGVRKENSTPISDSTNNNLGDNNGNNFNNHSEINKDIHIQETKDISPDKLRTSMPNNTIIRNTKIFRNNSLNQGKIEKSMSPFKIDGISNKNRTNKVLKDIIPKNKQLFVIYFFDI